MNVTESPALFPASIGARATAAGESATGATTDFQTFLTLLTAQLRNQDPMQPIDSTEFVAQLASFTSAEQLIGVNERLDALQAQGVSAEIAALGGWIGKEVAATDGSFRATGGPVALGIPPGPPAERVNARVLDRDGTERASFEIDNPAQGVAYWTGRDDSGAFLRDQDLHIVVDFSVGDTVVARHPALVHREVVAIRAAAGGIALDLADGGSLDATKVAQLREPPAGTPLGS